MSLFNTMRTSVAGMSAQSNALGTIGDNIANASTTGYKRAGAEFETMLGQNVTSEYVSGGVQTVVRNNVVEQGTLRSTTSPTDLAVSGSGFFVVSQGGQGSYLTRAGSFVPDSSGNLVNAAGFQLMGYQINGTDTSSNLTPVTLSTTSLQAAPSTEATLVANVPSSATAVAAGSLPSTNSTNATYTDKTSITVYDNLGTADILDVYFTKTGSNTWEATAYQQSAASASGGFPYSSAAVGKTNIAFDSATGKVSSGGTLNVSVPNGNQVKIDMSGMTQLASDFAVTSVKADGNSPSRFDHVKIASDGTLTEVYASGAQITSYKIPLGIVTSPDNLTPLSGNVYEQSANSGNIVISTPGENGVGSIEADSLEQSTVDIATELTNMIEAQRAYEANSKVLQTGSDLLGVLNRLTIN